MAKPKLAVSIDEARLLLYTEWLAAGHLDAADALAESDPLGAVWQAADTLGRVAHLTSGDGSALLTEQKDRLDSTALDGVGKYDTDTEAAHDYVTRVRERCDELLGVHGLTLRAPEDYQHPNLWIPWSA